MELNLKRPLAFFDLETTGVNISTDRIVEIGILIINTDNSKKEYRFLVNPTVPIPIESSVIHGIYDKDVEDAPTFEDLAPRLFRLLNPCDLGGYNSNRFDIPLLVEEFMRVNVNFRTEERNLLDAFTIFVMYEKRDLTSAYKFFCDKKLENAHSAMADVKATFEVFEAQIKKYGDLENDMEFIAQKTNRTKNSIDNGNRMTMLNGVACFNFGKNRGKPIEEVLKKDSNYYDWMMKSDFTLHTKFKLTEIKKSLGL